MAASYSADPPMTSTSTFIRDVTPHDNVFPRLGGRHDRASFQSPETAPSNLLSPFAHLPTPTSPHNVATYGQPPPPPQSPLDNGLHRASVATLGRAIFTSGREYPSRVVQMITPESSPLPPSRVVSHPRHGHFSSSEPHHRATVARVHGDVLGDSALEENITPLAPAPVISPLAPPFSSGAPATSRMSTPFMAKLAATNTQRITPTSVDHHTPAPQPLRPVQLDDVFTAHLSNLAPPITLATVPQPPSRPTPADQDQLEARLMADEAARLQAIERARPDYLRRVQRASSPAFAPFDDSSLPGLGITVSPMKGRRIKLFQETSEESFEESLMAGGYGKYRTVPDRPSTPEMQQRTLDWLEQGTPHPSGVPAPTAAVTPANDKELNGRELLKRKRLAAFHAIGSSPPKLRAVQLEGIGRVVVGIEDPEAVPVVEIPTVTKRGKNRKKKLLPVTGSPGKRKIGLPTDPEDGIIDGPGWLDAEFPWSLRAYERAEGERRDQAERLKYIEKYLERDSDDEHSMDDEVPLAPVHNNGLYQRESSMGSGIVFVPDGSSDARLHLQNTLRRHHERTTPCSDSPYMRRVCICKRVDDGSRELVQCDDCHEWYHLPCVGIHNIQELGADSDPWYCTRCTLGRVPSPLITPPTQMLPPMRSEPAFAFNYAASPRERRTDIMFAPVEQSPSMPTWTAFGAIAPPSTPSRGSGDGNTSSVFSSRSSWADSGKLPATPRSAPRPASGGLDIIDEPYDPSATPSRNFKNSGVFATPRGRGPWSGSGAGLLSTPGKRLAMWGEDDEYRHFLEDGTPVQHATPGHGVAGLPPRHPPSPTRRPTAR